MNRPDVVLPGGDPITSKEIVAQAKTRKSILLVEDEMEFSEILKDHLEVNGYAVTIARDGVQGMKKIIEQDFDAVICDLLMPNLAGDMFYAGVERVKPQLCDRFIFITGHQENPRVKDFLRRVRALTLFKPFPMSIMNEALKVTMGKKAAWQPW